MQISDCILLLISVSLLVAILVGYYYSFTLKEINSTEFSGYNFIPKFKVTSHIIESKVKLKVKVRYFILWYPLGYYYENYGSNFESYTFDSVIEIEKHIELFKSRVSKNNTKEKEKEESYKVCNNKVIKYL